MGLRRSIGLVRARPPGHGGSIVAAALLAFPLTAPLAGQAVPAVDWLIAGGSVYDGSGGPPRRVDVGLRADRVAFIGDAAAALVRATQTIDARGLVVAPGFIDPHTHTADDLADAEGRLMLPFLLQGVTTVVLGNDGGGPFDLERERSRWARPGIGTNAALHVGHGTVRRAVMGMADRAPTRAELDSMRALVRRGMEQGALGLSTGLYYAPGSYATTDEVVELASVAASFGGIYDSHQRDESSYTIGLLASVGEVLDIAGRAGIAVHIAHLKALGRDVWGRSDSVIALIRAGRAEGLRVTADQYPYVASGSSIGAALLPRWAEAGGRDSLRARLRDPAERRRIEGAMLENLRRRGGAASLLLIGGPPGLVGKTLERIAREQGRDSIEAAIAIVAEGDAAVASFNMDERDVESFMRQDFVVTGSDGSDGHPRKYGTFARKLREYVFTRGVVSLSRAVEAGSAQTAAILGLEGRGRLREGCFADVVVFDSTTITDRATYERPRELAVGVRHVFVNGALAVRDGRPTRALAGRPLRRGD
jgi:N-acyl-D-aspartate/D-glutamate deacylase